MKEATGFVFLSLSGFALVLFLCWLILDSGLLDGLLKTLGG